MNRTVLILLVVLLQLVAFSIYNGWLQTNPGEEQHPICTNNLCLPVQVVSWKERARQHVPVAGMETRRIIEVGNKSIIDYKDIVKHLSDSVPQTNRNITIFAAILSSPYNFDRRQAVRDSWIELARYSKKCLSNNITCNFIYKFVIGTNFTTNREETYAKLKEEEQRYDDILWIKMEDTYTNLGLKVFAMYMWTAKVFFPGEVTHILKTDDDSYVRLHELFDQLVPLPTQRLYWGFFHPAPVKTTGRFENKAFALDTGLINYPYYSDGSGYVVSKDVADFLGQSPIPFRTYWTMEDCAVGFILSSLNLYRVQDPRFGKYYGQCRPDLLLLHKLNDNEIKKAFRYDTEGTDFCRIFTEFDAPDVPDVESSESESNNDDVVDKQLDDVGDRKSVV